MSPNELDLRASLLEDADRIDVTGDFSGPAIALDRHRARRRVSIVAAAVAAGLVGVTVPILWSGPGRDVDPRPATPTVVATSTAPTPSPSATGTPTSAPTSTPTNAATTEVAPVGAGADAYAVGDRLVVDGKPVQLQRGTLVERFAVLDGGGIVLTSHMPGGNTENEILDSTGHTIKALPDGTWVLSTDRKLLVFGDSSSAVVYDPSGTAIARRADSRWPTAFVGDHVYLKGEQTASLDWNVRSGATRELPGDIVAVNADRTRAAVSTAGAGDGMTPGCWGVRDLTRPGYPSLIERCGEAGNPSWFMPTDFSSQGTYLVGGKYVDGGFWFIAAVFRVSDGKDMLGGTDRAPVAGWTWKLAADEQSFLFSRNTSTPVSPAKENALQRCTLDLACTDVAPTLPLLTELDPRYTVGR